ncbi:MAG: NACHT domain-containing protein [Candidatus Symbiodolus clandestinus]
MNKNLPIPSGRASSPKPTDYAAGGLKQTLHGTIYQLQLLIFFMKRAFDKGYDFRLATEMEAAEKFDDMVLRYQVDGQNRYRFLQAKHRQDEHRSVTLSDLTNDSEGDFSLLKYLASYLSIQKKDEFKKAEKDFILCTNVDLDVDTLKRDGTFTVEEIADKDDLITIENSGKTPHLYRLKIDEKSIFYQKLRNNTEINRLAKFLIERQNNGRLDLSVDIFKRYHIWLAQEVINTKNKKFHTNFISGNKLSDTAQNFREVFIQCAFENKDYQNDKNKLFGSLRNKTFSISKNFGLRKEKSRPQSPAEFHVSNSQIKDFFNQFILAVNQPSEDKLRTIIESEIGLQFNLLKSDLVADNLQRKMLDWFKEKKGRFLSKQDGETFFEDLLKNIDTLKATGLSMLSNQLNAYDIHFDQAPLELLQQHVENSEIQILHLISSENPRLTLIKVYQLLQLLPQYQRLDSVLFTTDIMNIEAIQQTLRNAFSATDSHLLLAIECSSEKIGDTESLVNQLTLILKKQPYKKIIVISSEKHPLPVAFQKNKHLSYQSVSDFCSFSELTRASQTNLLDKEVIFQGQAVALKKLITSTDPITLSLPLIDLIKGFTLEIGQPLPSVQSKVDGYYIERYMAPTFINNAIIRAKNAGIFKDLIAIDEESFKEMCLKNPKSGVHWIQGVSDSLIWRRSQGKVNQLHLYIDVIPPHIYESDEKSKKVFISLEQSEQQRVIMLSAAAGMGKSTFFAHIAQQLKIRWPSYWIIGVDLNYHVEALRILQHGVIENTSPLDLITTFITESLLNLKTSFEKKLLYHALNSSEASKVILMLDGFDEIPTTCQDPAIMLLKRFLQNEKIQLWVTIRSNSSLEKELVQCLNQLPFSLIPLSPTSQSKFLGSKFKEEFMNKGVVSELEKLKHIVDNPLQLQIFSEIYVNLSEEGNISQDFLTNLDVFKLYQNFIITKYSIFVDKLGESKSQIKKILYEDISPQKNHQKLAFELLFPEKKNSLLKEFSLDTIKLMKDEELVRFGMVNLEGNTLKFIHRNYAEYYIAEIFLKKLIDEKQNHQMIYFLLRNILLETNLQVVRMFLNENLKNSPLEIKINNLDYDLKNRNGDTCFHIAYIEKILI